MSVYEMGAALLPCGAGMGCPQEHGYNNINIEVCLLSACHMQDTPPHVLHIKTQSLQQPQEGGTIIFIFLKKTLEHREVK